MHLPDVLFRLQNNRVRRLAGHWLERRRGRPMPSLADIDMERLDWAQPNLWLLEHRPEDDAFAYCLAGEQMIEWLGGDPVGRTVDAVFGAECAAYVHAILRPVVRDRALGHQAGPVYRHCAMLREGERLLLPLSGDGNVVSHILGLTVRSDHAVDVEPLAANAGLHATYVPVADLSADKGVPRGTKVHEQH